MPFSPELYPDLIESNDFLTSLFDVKVKSLDGTINTTYYDYLATKQKYPWWTKTIKSIKILFTTKDTTSMTSSKVNFQTNQKTGSNSQDYC